MKNRILFAFLLLVFFAAACETEKIQPAAEPIGPDTIVKFSTQIVPIFNASCNNASCHSAGRTKPDLSGTQASYTDLVNIQNGWIDTTNTSNSLLYTRMTSTSDPMPESGNLPETTTNIVKRWIQQGAKNN